MMGHQVDGHLCRALMNTFEAAGRHAMALQLLDTMDKEVDADLDTYNSALRTLAKAGRWKEAVEVVDRILEAGLRPDNDTARAAVEACQAGGQMEEARKAIEKIEASGVVVDDDIKTSTQ